MEEFKIRDKRISRQFYTDNEFIDGYAKFVGWQAQCVYAALVRHSRDSICFPSLQHLSIELGISISSIQEGIKQLKEYNIVRSIMRTKTGTGRGSNIYQLQDYTVWKSNEKIRKDWSNKKKEIVFSTVR
jgi:DNA-binding transcriptional regulator GbsR (MarR family)